MKKIADLRENAAKRLQDVEELRRQYLKEWEALQESIAKRKELAGQVQSVQYEIAGIRVEGNNSIESTLNQFLPEKMDVSIEFKAGGDKGDFGSHLHRIFGRQSKQKKRVADVIETHCSPIAFANLILNESMSELVGKAPRDASLGEAFDDEDNEFVTTGTRVSDYDSSGEVPILAEEGAKLESVLQLQGTRFDDYEAISLNGGPVNEKSPGQRSSAILPLIALSEKAPLVIDQPEDNLDKKLIGGVLTKVLAGLKEKRQIIVCTHDPNILVGGDAEQVVVMEAVSDKKGRVVNHGSIDNGDIVQTIIDLLEGGEEAFSNRQKHYGIGAKY